MAKSHIIEFPDKHGKKHNDALGFSPAQILNSLITVSNIVTSELDAFFTPYELTYARWQVLVLFSRNGNKGRPTYIAEKQNITRATTTGLIIGLEKDGFVTRGPCKKDGRQICVTLTAKSKKALKDIAPAYSQKINEILSCLTQNDTEALKDVLSKIILKNAVV